MNCRLVFLPFRPQDLPTILWRQRMIYALDRSCFRVNFVLFAYAACHHSAFVRQCTKCTLPSNYKDPETGKQHCFDVRQECALPHVFDAIHTLLHLYALPVRHACISSCYVYISMSKTTRSCLFARKPIYRATAFTLV